MGISNYNNRDAMLLSAAARRSTPRVPIESDRPDLTDSDAEVKKTKMEMLNRSSSADGGVNAMAIGSGGLNFKNRQTVRKATSLRQKSRKNSNRRCQRTGSFTLNKPDQNVDLLDDFYYNSQTECILSKISDWSFDVFALEKATNGRALFYIIFKLFQHHNLIEHFDLDVVKLMTFATLVEEGYQNNPYHNATHAADVTQAMHCYISQGKIAVHMTPIEILISLVSAITHDVDHPGVNQGFLTATNNHLATLYQNKSVLEKHHWRSALALIHQTGLFDHLSDAERSKIEMEMKSLILATDMTRQQEFLSSLKSRVAENSLNMAAYADRHFILQIALKCADISNPCRHWAACKSWSERVCEEFFRQGDLERELDLTISNLCDRYTNSIPNIQTGFIDYCVQPLFTEFEKYLFPSSTLSEQLNNLSLNRQRWQEKIKAASRPTTLRIAVNDNTQTSATDIPSPTLSDSGDIPSPTLSESGDLPTLDISKTFDTHLALDNELYEADIDRELTSNLATTSLDRRSSLPVLIESKILLSRRQSFPARLNMYKG